MNALFRSMVVKNLASRTSAMRSSARGRGLRSFRDLELTPRISMQRRVSPSFLGTKSGLKRARLGNVDSIVLADALVEQFLLVVGQAALAFPIGLCVPGVNAEVAMLVRVNCADIKFVQANDALQVREKVADLLRMGRVCRKVCGWDGNDEVGS